MVVLYLHKIVSLIGNVCVTFKESESKSERGVRKNQFFITLIVIVNTFHVADVRPLLLEEGKCFCEASGHRGFHQQS